MDMVVNRVVKKTKGCNNSKKKKLKTIKSILKCLIDVTRIQKREVCHFTNLEEVDA